MENAGANISLMDVLGEQSGGSLASLPTANDLHVAQVLTNLSLGYRNDLHIWRNVLPGVRVARKKDNIREYTRDDWLRPRAGVRGNGRGPRGGYTVTTQSYECISYSMSVDVTDDERNLASDVDDPDVSGTWYCSDQVNQVVEQLVADLCFTAGNFATTTTLSGTTQWSDGQSDPNGDISTGKATVAAEIGREPNIGVMGRAVWTDVRNHPDILARFVNTQTGIITPAMVAQLWDLDALYIGRAIKVTTKEGAATDTFANIWGSHMALLHVPTTAQLNAPAFGYTLIYEEEDFLTETWRNGNGATSDAIRVRLAVEPIALSSVAGYLIIDAT